MRALRASLLLSAILAAAGPARAEAPAALPSGDEVARRVNARDEGRQLSRRLVMELVDRGGDVRVRETRSYRKYFGDEKRSVLFFDTPKNLKDTAFLTFDHPEAGRDDDQWLYLPALRKTRRISGADRGGAFLGTDFSYEDIKKETRLSLEDYAFRTLRRESLAGCECLVLELTPRSREVARELGYGRILAWVDPESWLVRKAEYWDERGQALKTVVVEQIEEVDGIWTPHRMEATNHQTGHRTVIRFLDVDYEAELPDDLFSERALERGR